MSHHLNTNKKFMAGNAILAFAVIAVVVIFVFMSLNIQQQKKTNRNYIEKYQVSLNEDFKGKSISVFINDSLLLNKKIIEDTTVLNVNRFAKENIVMILDNKTDNVSSFNISKEGGEYFFGIKNNKVTLLSSKE